MVNNPKAEVDDIFVSSSFLLVFELTSSGGNGIFLFTIKQYKFLSALISIAGFEPRDIFSYFGLVIHAGINS